MSEYGAQHTPTPWHTHGTSIHAEYVNPDGKLQHHYLGEMATIYPEHGNRGDADRNAARIVACVNALADIPDELLGDVAGVLQSLLVWADPNLPYWKTDAASGRMMEFATKLAAARGEKGNG